MKCKICKKDFTKTKPLQVTCDYLCFWELAQKKIDEKRKKDWDAEKKIRREKLMTLSDYEKLAKKSFQKWIRMRDEKLPCISCGKSNCADWAAGHYFPAGVYSGLIFSEVNCHKQCNSYCNMFLSGNVANYRIGLVSRIGLEKVEELEASKDKLRTYKYTKDELIGIRIEYDRRIKFKILHIDLTLNEDEK